jgi:hypothetical protein
MTAEYYATMVAHEFGHIVGTDDGYNSESTKYINSIMCDQDRSNARVKNGWIGRKATYKDIQKALSAYKSNKWQWSSADR